MSTPPIDPRTLRLSDLQRFAREVVATDPVVHPSTVESIQQSLRVEGYATTKRSIRDAFVRLRRLRG